MDKETIISKFELKPLPDEGGLFRETYVSKDMIDISSLPSRYREEKHLYTSMMEKDPAVLMEQSSQYKKEKPLSTAIYYLLTDSPDSFSAIHRLASDEIWHFYLGDPVEMLLLFPDGSGERRILGQDISAGQQVQTTVLQNTWQGARLISGGRYALMGTTVAPGFDPTDYTHGDREQLCRVYPHFRDSIITLTRTL